MKLVVTIPAHNEERTIGDVVAGAGQSVAGIDQIEVLVINDRSSDRTRERALTAGATVIDLNRRTGLGAVFRTGVQHAMQRRADIIVNIDADGQFDPGQIPKLITPILNDEADFTTCTRFQDPQLRSEMPRMKYRGNQVVTRLINLICGAEPPFTDVSCGFRAFNREAIYRLTLFGNFTYTQEVFLDLFRKGLRIQEVPMKVRGEREHGRSRMANNLLRYGLHSAMIILRTVRDIKPLKFFGGLGGILFLLSALLGTGMLAWYLRTGGTSPYTSVVTITGVLLVLSFTLLVIGLLADMVGRHRQVTEELLYLARRRVYAEQTRKPATFATGKRQAMGGAEDDSEAPWPRVTEPVLRAEILARTEQEPVP